MPVQDYAGGLRQSRKGRMRIGLAQNPFFEGLHPQIRQSIGSVPWLSLPETAPKSMRSLCRRSSHRTVLQAEVYAYHAAHMAATPELWLPATLSKLRVGRGQRHGDLHQSQAKS